MDADIYAIAAHLRADGTPFVLATVVASYPPQSVRPGAKGIVHSDGTLEGWVGGGCVRPVVLQEAAEALVDGRPRLVRLNVGNAGAPAKHGDVREYPMTCQGEGGVEIYLEPVFATPRLVVLGNTPVAQSLARIGYEVGYEIVVAAPGASRELFPSHARIADDTSAALAGADRSTVVVVATMGAGDEEALAAAAMCDAPYVGLVASRKKANYLIDYVRATGVSEERLARVKFPAGLNLGGMNAPEIALSIVAEIVQWRHASRGTARAPTTEAATATASRAPLPLGPAAAAPPAPLPVDPICGMPVDPATAKHTLVVGAETIYFCCPHCKAAYEKRLRQSEAPA